jgi:hypothetical protein
MRGMNARAPRIAGLLALALGAVALLALSGVAAAKDHHGDDNGHHGRHHHHHFREMEEAGTISSFDTTTGRLTIATTGGETVSGLVTEETRISCEGVDGRRSDHRDHGGGDDHGGGNNGSGDDHGGNNEPGDDNGGAAEGEGGEPGEAPACTTAALVPGAFVGDAEVRLGSGVATFEEIELGHDS